MEKNSRVKCARALAVQGQVTYLEEGHRGGEGLLSLACLGLGMAGMGETPWEEGR